MDLKRLNVNKYIIKIELQQEYFTKNRIGTDNSFTNCEQLNEVENLIAEDNSKKEMRKLII